MLTNSRCRIACLCVTLCCCGWSTPAAEVVLPEGSAPAPIVTRHFPNRVHEFVWRNWNLVEPVKMAQVIGTTAAEVTAIAESMGLPSAVPISSEQKSRSYITVIRRNWHLLPYQQLLELLEMTPERLAFVLRDDDGVFWKLGMLKPKCAPLRYTAPDEAARQRAAEIKQVVDAEFGEGFRRPGEPRFAFLQQFQEDLPVDSPRRAPTEGLVAGEGQGVRAASAQSADDHPRFIYSYFALYGDPLWKPELDPYPNGLLRQLSDLGINGVWLHVVLRDMAPGGAAFPEFGAGHEQRLANLRALVSRAKTYGIGVYLYMNEPRAMLPAFFKTRPEMAGVHGTGPDVGFVAMCTSHPAVRQWLTDALAHILREVPELAGVFTITGSEGLTNCASRGGWKSCPQCKNRSDAEIIAEVNAAMEEGVHHGNPQAKFIAWDWGWRGHGDAPDIIARLPKSTWLMSVSEWALPVERGGIKTTVGEYAMSVVGPGPRATRHWKLAHQAGLKAVAKVQLNNTWELSTVPYLPVMDLVAEHCHNLASAGVDGMMLSWSLGGYPSPNLEISASFSARNSPLLPGEGQGVRAIPTVDEVLNGLAQKRYGPDGGPLARKAWTAFSTAFREYPYDGSMLYSSPAQMGPANLLYLEKTGYAATPVGIPYDDLAGWKGIFPADLFASQFEKVAAGWCAGIPHLKAAVEKAPANYRDEVQAELRFAQAAAIHFQAVANQTRFVLTRDRLANEIQNLSAEEQRALRSEIRRILRSEIDLARQEFLLTQADSRIGFEASNQYVFVPLDLAEKVVNCRWLLGQFQD